MSDYDHFGQAWRISPSDYLKTRPSVFSLGEPKSQYVTMKDGIRLAIDVYLPGNLNTKQSAKFPTIMVLTPYYRRFKITEKGAEPRGFGAFPKPSTICTSCLSHSGRFAPIWRS